MNMRIGQRSSRARRAAVGLTLAGLSLGLAACRGGADRNAGAAKTIGVTLLTREDEFYRELEAGL
ncbi:MAG TPA: hypothetical protein VMH39_01840, partial [Gemmatimonadaceae bacterium]|nr:hypothetical protein [Gemmatimonadaceae bacterium]